MFRMPSTIATLITIGLPMSVMADSHAHFSPYVDVTLSPVAQWSQAQQSMQPTGLIDMVHQSHVNGLHLAFVTANQGACQAGFASYAITPDSTDGYGNQVFKSLQDDNIDLTISFGGNSGTYLAQACDLNPLINEYQKVIDAYQPSKLDFDIENNLQTDDVQLAKMMTAIKTVVDNNAAIKISFTLPVLPSGLLESGGFNVLRHATEKGIDFSVNIMAMDYGPSFTDKSMGDYAIDAATATVSQLQTLYPQQAPDVLWKKIEITPMIGINDTTPLKFTLADAQLLTTFASTHHINQLSMWSLNRDHTCADKWVSTDCSSADDEPFQTKDYEYTAIFIGQ